MKSWRETIAEIDAASTLAMSLRRRRDAEDHKASIARLREGAAIESVVIVTLPLVQFEGSDRQLAVEEDDEIQGEYIQPIELHKPIDGSWNPPAARAKP